MAKQPKAKPSAKQAAVRLLRYTALSKKQLGERLEAKGYGTAEIRAAVAELEGMGVLSDSRLAQSAAMTAVAKAASIARTREELDRKGVAAETAAKAIRLAEADDGRSDRQRAEDLARTKLGGVLARLDTTTQRRRLAALLARRGHDEETVESVVQSLVPEVRTDELSSELEEDAGLEQPVSPPPRRRRPRR